MKKEQLDPKGLIRESFRIEALGMAECRSIFLDWALSLPEGQSQQQAAKQLLQIHALEPAEHPMRHMLTAATQSVAEPKRRGGWRARRQGQSGI